ncbi:glucosamine-6-phosphate deaminase [Fulvivirgaceae bacterium BMA12]|uniref:Glucosamine-6-phosphate deaminase n=1 Tax=Agaribacillus aureus TaxID=3051825 RepID=A0ABT8L1W4_9BACT|nr:glucosamine-6-phosphate deaminase [Fulvivirgaceae bacterium BMA12]
MKVVISENKEVLGTRASAFSAKLIHETISQKGAANIVLATGSSQFEMLESLIKEDINWSLVTCFHLDEYIGLPMTHRASFRKYLKERFVDKVQPGAFYFINGEVDPLVECQRLGDLIARHPIDLAFVGIGENAHLAFNDPPADFETEEAFLEVVLDEDCRNQQFGEGWFEKPEEVPQRAISMSVKQILKAKNIVCSVPDSRKATAVKAVIEGPVTANVPASILQQHKNTAIFLDNQSSALLSTKQGVYEK